MKQSLKDCLFNQLDSSRNISNMLLTLKVIALNIPQGTKILLSFF